MPVEELTEALWASYQAETLARGHRFIADDATRLHVLAAAEWLADPKGKAGLMLQGLYGNGKTTLMLAICNLVNYLYGSPKRDERYEFEIAEARQIAMLGTEEKSGGRYKELCRTPLLAIDDLGEEPAEIMKYGMVYTPVKDLLLERYRAGSVTIVSTNLINTAENPQLDAHYGKRVVDRFREMMKIVVFKNGSYRPTLSNTR